MRFAMTMTTKTIFEDYAACVHGMVRGCIEGVVSMVYNGT